MDPQTNQSTSILRNKVVLYLVVITLATLSLFLIAKTMNAFQDSRYIGAGIKATNTIAVSGTGKILATPNIATFSVTIRKDALKQVDAQKLATVNSNTVITYLKEKGVTDKDIQTTNYSINPRYEYSRSNCGTRYCPPSGKRTLIGYEVTQTLRVKVRDINTAGTILAGVGTLGVNNVGGLVFENDNKTTLQAQARRKAITDAKQKAQVLAKDLGVSLVRVVSFNESNYNGGPIFARALSAEKTTSNSPVPTIPTGENEIRSNVNITYEIR